MLILQIFPFRSLLMIALLLVATATSSCAQEKPKRMIPGPSVKELVPELPNEKEDGVSQIILAQLSTPGPTEYTHVGTSALKNSPPLPTGYTLYKERVYEVKTQAIIRLAFNITVFNMPSVDNEKDFKNLAILHLKDDEMSSSGKSWNEVTLFLENADESIFNYIPNAKYDSLQPDFKSKRIAAVSDKFGIFAIALAPESLSTSTEPFTQIEVKATSSPERARLGSDVTHTITLTNKGLRAAGDVNLIEALDGDFDFISADSDKGYCQRSSQNVGHVVCHLGDLASGAGVTITVHSRVSKIIMLTKDSTGLGTMLEVAFKETPTDFFDPVNRVKAQINTTIVREQ